MEQSPKTSFIPKEIAGSARMKQRRSINLLAFFATVIFIATLAFSVGVYFYKQYEDQRLDAKKTELELLRKSFEVTEIDNIRNFERRVNAAQLLLDQHISLSRVFDALQEKTQKKAQLINFEFSRLESGTAQVSLQGESVSFNTAALQKSVLAGESSFQKDSVLFSDINTTGQGDKKKVTFKVSAFLNTKEVLYTGEASGTGSTTLATPTGSTTTQGTSSNAIHLASSTITTTYASTTP